MAKWEYKTVKFDFNEFLISGNFDEKKFSNDINYERPFCKSERPTLPQKWYCQGNTMKQCL